MFLVVSQAMLIQISIVFLYFVTGLFSADLHKNKANPPENK
jgi:hypothetical protein